MGIENNECILATTWDNDSINKIKQWIDTLSKAQQQLFAFIPSIVNKKTTIVLGSCGSKKNWEEDKQHALLRIAFINLMESFRYDDESNAVKWIEVGYGEYGAKVLRSNCINVFSEKEYGE